MRTYCIINNRTFSKMKKLLFGLLGLLFSLNSYSQTGKFRPGVFYSFDNNFSSDRISFDKYSGYSADYNKSNFSAGLSLDYSISGKLILVSGINYSDKSFTGKYYCDVCDISTPPGPEKIEIQFIEIPVIAKYYFLRSRFDVFAEGGIGNLWRVNHKTDLEVEKYFLSAKLGGGIEYPFLDRYSLQLSVVYTQNLTEVFRDAEYDYRIFAIKFGFLIDL